MSRIKSLSLYLLIVNFINMFLYVTFAAIK
jgi:hypothetical protein